MAIEIERKFLVQGDYKSQAVSSARIMQGYISASPERSVRIRIRGNEGFLTIKGASDASGLNRYEFEQKLTLPDAEALMKLCLPGVIHKIRYLIPAGAHTWEVDEFLDDNAGLVMAEIELQHENDTFPKPDWLGEEVTGDVRFYNAMLSKNPYKNWKTEFKQQ